MKLLAEVNFCHLAMAPRLPLAAFLVVLPLSHPYFPSLMRPLLMSHFFRIGLRPLLLFLTIVVGCFRLMLLSPPLCRIGLVSLTPLGVLLLFPVFLLPLTFGMQLLAVLSTALPVPFVKSFLIA